MDNQKVFINKNVYKNNIKNGMIENFKDHLSQMIAKKDDEIEPPIVSFETKYEKCTNENCRLVCYIRTFHTKIKPFRIKGNPICEICEKKIPFSKLKLTSKNRVIF